MKLGEDGLNKMSKEMRKKIETRDYMHKERIRQ